MPHEILAVVFLTLCAVAPLVWASIWFARTSLNFVQGVLWIVALFIARLLWRAQLPRKRPAGVERGAVLVSNHRSSIDAFFPQLCFDRPLHWMVAREYCEHPAFGWLLRTCEVIPVSRSGIDTAATRAAIRYAERGDLISMFPEGRINMTDDFMLPVRPGAVLVALRARAPLLPCYITGSPYGGTPWSPFFMPARVRLVFGEVIDLSPYYDREHDESLLRELMFRVVREIARLAGREDFQPTLAGRRWKPLTEAEEAISKGTE